MCSIHEVPLEGCTPEPLMGYLKALGVLRLITEQKDRDAKGCWRNGVFVVKSRLDSEAVLDFFVEQYKPTPIIVPWSGADFFGVDIRGSGEPHKDTPSGTAVIEAFIASTSERLLGYRRAIKDALDVLKLCGIKNKERMKDKVKAHFMSVLRSRVDEPVVRWIDVCTAISPETEKLNFNTLLGSGGGSDGNTHFSDNFMQNLWEVLPDFNNQRKTQKPASRASLENALYGIPFLGLVPKRTSSLYDGGAVGGPNAGQGFERDSLGNPWSIILCIEGTVLLAGCVAKRHRASPGSVSSFPFQTRLSATLSDSASNTESTGREIWLPLWSAFAGKTEIEALFSEGRASVGRNESARAVDFARAAASLGVDRGINAFQRFAIVKGRIGGDNYNTSASFGCFDVRDRPDVRLLTGADGWLNRFRKAASGDNVPPRFGAALRRIDSAIFAFCRFGGRARFAEILCAFGNAERELGQNDKLKEDKSVQPLFGLSGEWLRAADDKSTEFELARALAGIYDREKKVDTIRSNLEPVSSTNWRKSGFCHVWTSANLSMNLLSILERRFMDAKRFGCQSLPFSSRHTASSAAIGAYIEGQVDDGRIEELLWGMILVDHWKLSKEQPPLHFEMQAQREGESLDLIPRPLRSSETSFSPRRFKSARCGH